MRRYHIDGLAWYAFQEIGEVLEHAFITRLGGVSTGPFTSLNLGSAVGDDPTAVAENHRRVCAALALKREQVVSPHQVHGNSVRQVHRGDGGTIIPETDALMTNEPGVALLLRFADCTPVLLYDSEHHAITLIHAGWRGVAAAIAPTAVQAMQMAFATRPAALWAGIGPAIGPQHYAVTEDIVMAIQATVPGDVPIARQESAQWYLDMPKAVAAQLAAAGVRRIEHSGLDTAGNTAEWYSHRAEQGHTGRFGALALLR